MRRVVLRHTTGPYTNLCQILGTDNHLPSFPHVVEGVTFLDGRVGQTRLARLEDRYVLYEEVASVI